jgi:hypothetical protein
MPRRSQAQERAQHARQNGLNEGERQARKARAGTDIGDVLAHKVSMDRKAIKQMMRQHLLGVPDRRKVIGAVPARELIEQRAQPHRILFGERNAQRCGVPHEALE